MYYLKSRYYAPELKRFVSAGIYLTLKPKKKAAERIVEVITDLFKEKIKGRASLALYEKVKGLL